MIRIRSSLPGPATPAMPTMSGMAGMAAIARIAGLAVLALALLALTVGTIGVAPAGAQITTERPLRPLPPSGNPVVPFMEGWYGNDDGSVTISFGYYNLNRSDVVEIPLGEDNRLEPAEFDGMQPSTFLPGRQHGAFAVTLPQERRDEDVWWYITDEDGEEYEVPGRARASAYELDRTPRPQGSVAPVVWFEDEGSQGTGPDGSVAPGSLTTSVGSPVTLAINATDPSQRDSEDRRFRDGVPLRVVWLKHQGPGDVTFTRHELTPEDQGRVGEGLVIPQMRPTRPGPNVIILPEGQGTARVVATFSEPGDYMLRARVDNFAASDSNALDQCCWTNGYVRVSVEP